MYGQQPIIQTPEDIANNVCFLQAYIDKLAELAMQRLYTSTDITKKAICLYVDPAIELVPGYYFSIYVMADDRISTCMPGIVVGSTPQDIQTIYSMKMQSDPGLIVEYTSDKDLAMLVTKFKENTSKDITIVQSPAFSTFNQDQSFANIIKNIFIHDYMHVLNYITTCFNNGQYLLPISAQNTLDNTITQLGRNYYSVSGPAFRVVGGVLDGNLLIELGFNEHIMRLAKRDKAFRNEVYKVGMGM